MKQEVAKIRKGKVRSFKRMMGGTAVGPDDTPVKVWEAYRELLFMCGCDQE